MQEFLLTSNQIIEQINLLYMPNMKHQEVSWWMFQ